MKYKKALRTFSAIFRLEIACTATLSIKAILLLPFASTQTGASFGAPPSATFATTTSSRLVQLQNSVPVWGPDPAFAGRWRPLRTGAGHGRPGRPPGRCGCAVTSLLQRDGGGAVRFRQEIWLPAQPVVVARRRERGCVGGGAGGGVGAPRAALGGRTHRLCLDAARIRGGGGCCDGAGERGERRGGRRRGYPPVVDGHRRGAG